MSDDRRVFWFFYYGVFLMGAAIFSNEVLAADPNWTLLGAHVITCAAATYGMWIELELYRLEVEIQRTKRRQEALQQIHRDLVTEMARQYEQECIEGEDNHEGVSWPLNGGTTDRD